MNILRFTLPLLTALTLAGPALAESFPVDNPDPHASSWGQRGSFTLYYYGQLNDGTACPPSPNALQFAIIGGGRGLEYLHNYGVSSAVAPHLQAPFEKGTFCSLAFDGEVRFLLHHGQSASIMPTAVSPVEPTPVDEPTEQPTAGLEGRFTIQYAPIMCIMAPCPPGSYSIILDGAVIGQVASIDLEDRSVSPTTIMHFAGQYLPFEEIEGSLELNGPAATIVINR